MISGKTRQGFFILLVLAGITTWVTQDEVDNRQEQQSDVDPNFNYVLRDFELQYFDENGQPSLSLKAPMLQNDPNMQLGTIEQPVVRLYQPGLIWDLQADVATVTADKEFVNLNGSVNIERQQIDTGRQTQLRTTDVKIEVTPQTATTDALVEVFDGPNQFSGFGMDLDMMANTFELKRQVKATYAVN